MCQTGSDLSPTACLEFAATFGRSTAVGREASFFQPLGPAGGSLEMLQIMVISKRNSAHSYVNGLRFRWRDGGINCLRGRVATPSTTVAKGGSGASPSSKISQSENAERSDLPHSVAADGATASYFLVMSFIKFTLRVECASSGGWGGGRSRSAQRKSCAVQRK